MFADGQDQARSFAAAGDGAVELAELFEDLLLLFGRDAGVRASEFVCGLLLTARQSIRLT